MFTIICTSRTLQFIVHSFRQRSAVETHLSWAAIYLKEFALIAAHKVKCTVGACHFQNLFDLPLNQLGRCNFACEVNIPSQSGSVFTANLTVRRIHEIALGQ
jgi:hypothetical protein